MKKLISFVVPCYNSESYMKKCIDSLLVGKDAVEIIIIDDGSKDKTGIIADKYQEKYPDIIKVVHKTNGGHGSGINHGLKLAKGKYFKVVDSDDWVDKNAYKELLKRIDKIDSDLIVMNYVYTYTDGRLDQVIKYNNVFKENQEITWNEINNFKIKQYLTLHSTMYKTEILKKSNINLPKHVFYEDNLFIYLPLINTKTIYYLNVDFYRYYIGRAGQSVSQEQLIKRSADQVLISKLVCNAYDLEKLKLNNYKLYYVMRRECILMATIGTLFSRLRNDELGESQYIELWASIEKENPTLYKSIRHFTLASIVSIPGPIGRIIAIYGYKISHMIVKFN